MVNFNRFANRPHNAERSWTRVSVRAAATAFVIVLLFSVVRPVLAGWVPAYVRASGLPIGVLLEWGTVSEYNLSGFEILCKLATEPEDAFHPIGSVPATGSLESGANYSFLVDSGLQPGISYCFRIREISFTEEPEEFRDLCGYGIDLEPVTDKGGTELGGTNTAGTVDVIGTAVVPLTPPVQTLGGTPTPIIINPATAADTTSAPGQPTATFTPLPGANPPAFTPTATPFAESPLSAGGETGATPTMTATADIQADAANSPLGSAPVAAENEGVVAASQFTDTNEASNQSPLASPAVTATPTWAPVPPATPPAAAVPGSDLAADSVAANQAQAGGDGSYIVVTATPTSPAAATPNATFTPLPTTTAAPSATLLGRAADPTVENLILMTLCFIFLGAGGIGALGLTTTVLYIRSRNDRPG